MATFEGFFVSTEGRSVDEVFSGIRGIIDRRRRDMEGPCTARYREPHPWVQVEVFHEYINPLARRISGELETDVISLQIQTVVDAFLYSRFTNGREARCLVYGENEQGVWETVRGEPEEWETPVIFKDGRVPKHSHDDPEVCEIYEKQVIEEGAFYPSINTSFAPVDLGEALNLPGFSGKISLPKKEQYWTRVEVLRRMGFFERMKLGWELYGWRGLFLPIDYEEDG
jgi:hypothetical protein